MKPNWALSFFAGVVGAVLMTILFALGRAFGGDFNLELILGSWITRGVGVGTWVLGFIVHVLLGGAFGVVYAAAFHTWRRTGMAAGLALSIPHVLLAGLFFWILPSIHAAMPERPEFPVPGYLAVHYGTLAVLQLVLFHLVYGAVVGEIYRERPAEILREDAVHSRRVTSASGDWRPY